MVKREREGEGGYIYDIRYVAYGVVHAVRIDVIFKSTRKLRSILNHLYHRHS